MTFKCTIDEKGKPHLSKNGWVTSVVASKIEKSSLRKFSNEKDPLGAVCAAVCSAFRKKLKETGIQIKIVLVSKDGSERSQVVQPLEYPGKRIYREIQTKFGPVKFEVFLTSKPQKNPEILIDHQDVWQLPLSNLDIWGDVFSVFGSGHIQGIISLDFCELLSDRTGFKWSEELDALNDAVLEFAVDHGQRLVDGVEGDKRLDKFERAAKDVLDMIRKSGVLDDFSSAIKDFTASVTASHVNATKEDGHVLTTQENKEHEPSGEEKNGDGGKKKKKRKEVGPKDMVHGGVSSLTGTKRYRSVGERGFNIINSDWLGSPRAKFGTEGNEKGKIVINIMHDDYLEADRSIAALRDYVCNLVIGLLSSRYCSSPERASVFWEEYESTYMDMLSTIKRRNS